MSSPATTSPLRLCGIAAPTSELQSTSKELAISEATHASGNKQDNIKRAVMTARENLWTNGETLEYSFFGGTAKQQAKVESVIEEWMWYANIKFKKVAPRNPKATLRIAFDPTNGSWSYVGSSARLCAGPAPTINLGWITDSDTIQRKERGVILHEFGHALGLMHEHESPARSGAIRLKEKEIIQYYTTTQGWDEATVRKQVLDVYSKESVSNYSQFDPTSIMMYFMPASMNEGGVDIHEVTELSMLDKAFIVINYPRSTPHPRAPQWSPQFALLAAGASPETMKAYIEESDMEKKREFFTRDMARLRALEAGRSPLPGTVSQPQHAPHVQRGLDTNLSNNQLIEDALKELEKLELSNPQRAINVPNLVEHAIQRQAHAEMVQKGILGLLLEVAPLILLAPDIKPPGSSDVAHAVLDPNHLSLDHPVVQFGLKSFFTKLASNSFVKDAMSGAVKIAGNIAKEALENILPEHAAKPPPPEPQHALGDKLAQLAGVLVKHPHFETAVKTMVTTVAADLAKRGTSRVFDGPSEREKAFRQRMDDKVTRMLKKFGEDASEDLISKMDRLWEESE